MGNAVKALVEQSPLDVRLTRYGALVDDTDDSMRIRKGDVIHLQGEHFLVMGDASERVGGYQDCKFWVKRCRALDDGRQVILKLCFYEHFTLKLGEHQVRCHRSPGKEARILELVRGDERFMQGRTLSDGKGAPVRVIELVRGPRLDHKLGALRMEHEQYYAEKLPEFLNAFILAAQALADLHAMGERHGDVWRDHLRFDNALQHYRWIDFDYAYAACANPFGLDLFGLGEILLYIVGKGRRTLHGLDAKILARLNEGDVSLLHGNVLMNVRKLHPYVSKSLNQVLMHFSAGANIGYDSVQEFLEDLRACSV